MFIQTVVPDWNENRRSFDTCWLFSVFLQLKEKAMLTRNKVIQSVNNLPESFTIDELIDRLIYLIISDIQIDILRVYHLARSLTKEHLK